MRCVSLAALLAVALVLISCGSEEEVATSESLTVEEYAKQIILLQEDSRSAFVAAAVALVGLGTDPSPAGYRLVAEDRALAIQEGDRFFDAVGALRPPTGVVPEHEAFLAAWPLYRVGLEREKEVWATAETSADLDVLTPEAAAASRNPFQDACINLEDAVIRHALTADFGCGVDWFHGGGEFTTGGCIAISSDGTASEDSECPSDFERDPVPETRVAAMPPLPSGLVAASRYFEIVGQTADAGVTVGLPLLNPDSDPASLAVYTFRDGKWERIAGVAVRDVGTVIAEFTLLTYPENYAILQESR